MYTPLRSSSGLLRRILHLSSLLALVCTLGSRLTAADGDPVSPEEKQRGFRARTLLAKPRADLSAVERAEAGAQLRLLRAHSRLGGVRTLETDGKEDIKDVIARLQATGLYEYVEPDFVRQLFVLPDDPRFAADQWSLNNTGQEGGTPGADIKAAAAWEIQREAPDVVVAIIDTGVRTIHEDISANLWVNPGEQGLRPAIDDDANGYIDDINGINGTVAKTSFLAGDPSDEDGHGTHVAGIIGASGNNGKGVTGVAWKVQLMPLKFLGGRSGVSTVSALLACIDYAIAKKAHIINGSYGGLSFSQSEYDAMKRLRDAGIIFVAAAGNDSQEITSLPEYPAAYPLDNIVAVASTTRQDKLASYSTYGSGMVELAAPGSSILSLGTSQLSPYVTKSGTSMAAPHVTGALALLKQKFPNDSYRALINRVLSSVDVLPALDHKVQTNGRLNLLRALTTTDGRPFNDDFARRAVITGDFNTVRGSTQLASSETAEPDHGVPGASRTVWWSWTAPEDTGKVTLSTAGSGIDTVLAVYAPRAGTSATAPTFATLQRVAANDDASASVTTSSVTFDAVPGTTYEIAIAGKGGAEGLVIFNLTTAPIHDNFARAKLVSGPSVVVESNNTAATGESGEPKPKNTRGTAIGTDHSLWFKWVAPSTHPYQISAYGISTDPIVALYTGTALASLAEVAFDDDTGPGLDSLLRFTATANVTYYIRVDTSAGAGGRFTLNISDAAWQYVAEYPGYASPTVAADGTLYFQDGLGIMHAVAPDGTRKWRAISTTGFVEAGSLALGPDGTLYAGDDFGVLNAINPATGARKWFFQTQGIIWAPPAVASDGTIYVKSNDGQLYAVNPDGTEKWKAAVPGDTYAGPAIGADGTIYAPAADDTALYALNPDGTRKWRADLGATIYASPAIGSDGTIYLGNYDGRFFALRPDGTERWHFDSGSPLSGSAVLDARGYVYFGSYDKKLYALDAATGAKKWDYATGDIIRSTTPVVADDGTIYMGSDDGRVHALKPDGTLLRTYATAAGIYASPILAGGRFYALSSDAKLYAFDTGNNPARSAWPMARQNLRRFGRTEDLAGIPTFNTQPSAPSGATAGNAVSIASAATATGSGAVSYQWYFNDVAIPGATSATLTFPSAQVSNAGTYRVLATGSGGSTISTATTLAVTGGQPSSARLVNLAVRTPAGGGDRVLFMGFATGGSGTSGTKPLLIRGVGPSLTTFGVDGILADPRLQIFNGSTLLVENDDWAGNAEVSTVAGQVGAFGLAPATSKDAAILFNRAGGSYTAQVSGPGTTTGVVLAEIYDATPSAAYNATTPRLINVSARTLVGAGNNILIAGFVIGGTGTKTIMIRAIGPTLGDFGVPGVLANPRLDLFQSGNDRAIANNDDWGASTSAAQIATASTNVGAFPLKLESRDSVLLLTLQPGSYTAQVSGVSNSTGAALVEVYEVP